MSSLNWWRCAPKRFLLKSVIRIYRVYSLAPHTLEPSTGLKRLQIKPLHGGVVVNGYLLLFERFLTRKPEPLHFTSSLPILPGYLNHNCCSRTLRRTGQANFAFDKATGPLDPSYGRSTKK